MFNGNLLDFFWTMMIIFFWVTAIMIWFQCFFDAWRRSDIGGGMKAVWIIVLLVIPWFGALIYIIARPKVTAQDVQTLARADAANTAVSQVSTADEIAKLDALKAAGSITIPEYDALKAKLMA